VRRVAVAVAIIVVGALVADVPESAADPPGEETDAASIAAGFDDASPYPPISRLGRWDGASYVDVEPGSVDTDQVIVLSHGWEPGFGELYDELQAETSSLVTVWDPRMTKPEVGSAIRTIGPVAEALARAAPEATVMLFSWIDQSATPLDPFDARLGENATEINGHRLAVAVDQALADGWDGELHLLGHSFGSNIATTAALALDAPLRQLTLMDSPDDELARLGGAGNDLRYKLPRLDIGRSAGSTFVDNYISEIGIRYGDLPGLELVADTRLAPPDGGFSTSHEYPLVWYADVLQAGSTAPPIGPWWSPLLGGDPATVGAYYVQLDSAQPLMLTEEEGRPSAGVAADLAWMVVPLELGTGGSTLTVGDRADAVEVDLSTTERSLLLEFGIVFDGPAAGATLDVAVDGRLRYTAVGPDAGVGAPGAVVLLWDVEPGKHTLTVTLTGGGDGATATLSDLRIVETEGIVRNLDEQQTTELVEILVVVAAVAVIAALVGVALVVRALVRRRRAA
jgi:hypothetical protein